MLPPLIVIGIALIVIVGSAWFAFRSLPIRVSGSAIPPRVRFIRALLSGLAIAAAAIVAVTTFLANYQMIVPIPTTTPVPTVSPTPTPIPTPYILSQTNSGIPNIYLVFVPIPTQYTIGDELVVYKSSGITGASSQGEQAIALMRVVAINPDTVTAEVVLSLPDDPVVPNLRVDDNLSELSSTFLIPTYSEAIGYALGDNTLRLKPGVDLREGQLVQALEPQVVDGVILAYLPFQSDVQLRITDIDINGVIARFELVVGEIPAEGTLVRIPLLPVNQPSLSICGGSTIEFPNPEQLFQFDNPTGTYVYMTSANFIQNNRVRSIYVDENGVWLGFVRDANGYDGLAYFGDNRSLELCQTSDNQTTTTIGHQVNDIVRDSEGSLWVATDGDGVWRLHNQTWTQFNSLNSSLASDSGYTIVPESNALNVGTLSGILSFNGTIWSNRFSVASGNLCSNQVHAIVLGSDTWIGHIGEGLTYQRVNQSGINCERAGNNTINNDNVRSIVIDDNNHVWIATYGGGINVYDGQSWRTFESTNSALPSNNVNVLKVDKYGRIWAGTDGGTAFFDGSVWQLFTPVHTYDLDFGHSDCSDCSYSDEHVWIGTSGSGFIHGRLPANSAVITGFNITGIPSTLKPGQEFSPIVTVTVESGYTLMPGDWLHYTGTDNSFFPPNQKPYVNLTGRLEDETKTYSFNFGLDDVTIVAPITPGEYELHWRVRHGKRYVGETVPISFIVSE